MKRSRKLCDGNTTTAGIREEDTGEEDDDWYFSASDPDEVESNDRMQDDHEDFLSDVEWEEVPLNIDSDQVISISIDNSQQNHHREGNKRRKSEQQLEKRKQNMEIKRLCYSIHLIMIPFMLITLKQRIKWSHDIRLNRRLKRSVPKLIRKKFSKFHSLNEMDQKQTLRTLLIGLVFWFRSHYKVNSNGFRQNALRLPYLLKHSNGKAFKDILGNPNKYYGTRPEINLFNEDDPFEDIRKMAKTKMSNRDILVIFFAIILKNLFQDSNKKFTISVCFALPLMDYQSVNHKENTIPEVVPNKYDSDLLQPYFWIELENIEDNNELYIIDPIVNIKEDYIVKKYNIHEPINHFQTTEVSNTKQKFSFVISSNINVGTIMDTSPRYIQNLPYRYFNNIPNKTATRHSIDTQAYEWFMKYIHIINRNKPIDNCGKKLDLNAMARTNTIYPKTKAELVKSNNFTSPKFLRATEIIDPLAKLLGIYTTGNNREPLYWKNDIIVLKSKQHWNMLGRAVRPDSTPLKHKKYRPLRNQRHWKYQSQYENKELFSYDQTEELASPPEYFTDRYGQKAKITDVDYYKNKYNHIEIYLPEMKPKGFEILELNENSNIRRLLKKYNKSVRNGNGKLKYLDIVSGFNFKDRPGYAIPIINSILMNHDDYIMARQLLKQDLEVENLKRWDGLLRKMILKDRLDRAYGE